MIRETRENVRLDQSNRCTPETPYRGRVSPTLIGSLIIPAVIAVAGCAPIAAESVESTGANHHTVGIEPDSASRWVDSTMDRLTLRQKVGQLVAPWLAGDYLAYDSDSYDRITDWIIEQGVGGIVISIGPPLEVADKLNMMQELADVPLLITADMEHGPGQRLDGGVILPNLMENGGGTSFPPAMGLGATGEPGLAYELGRITAREARAVGIGMIFAPVVDVNNNPENPVINTRSYGADPNLVAEFATQHIRGLQEHGVLAVAKHFPGHGDTGVDSHIDLPLIAADRARADSVELPPFRAAIDAGVTGVMSAHITFPDLTGDTTPATLSPRALTGLLQEELGFSGLVVTDALDMGAIVRRYGSGEAMIRAIEAGADFLLMPPNLPTALDEVAEAVESGRLSIERIDHSVRKVLHLKARLGLHQRRGVPLDEVSNLVAGRAHTGVAEEVARRAITLPRDEGGLIPLGEARAGSTRLLSITYTAGPEPIAGRAFHQYLAPRVGSLRTAQIDEGTPTTRLDSLLAEAESADLILVSTFVRVVTGKGSVAIPDEIAEFITTLSHTRPTIVTSFGNPYLLQQFPDVGTYLLAWGGQRVAQRAAAQAILGDAPISGTLPIPIPPYHQIGTGLRRGEPPSILGSGDIRMLGTPISDPLPLVDPGEVGMSATGLAYLDEILDDAIGSGSIPGAALAVGRHGRLVRLRGFGGLDPRPGFGEVTDSTIYDLASLSKVIGTTTAVMILVEEGRLDLDAPVRHYLPEWGGDPVRDRVSVRQLLTHTAGLPPFAPLWREHRGRQEFLHRIAATELEYEPGTKELYSDFGMILIGIILERIAGEPLDHLLEERVFGPLGLHETGYNPLGWEQTPTGRLLAGKAASELVASGESVEGEPSILSRIAPTEYDTVYRMRHIHGEVHDENAHAIGGIAGHAGLFSSARDLAVFATMLLDGGVYADPSTGARRRLLRPETIRAFATRLPGGTSRALGWDTPAGRSSAGDYFSARSFGHTGFTGTSIWIDPERDLFVVLLTNRVNPTRENQSHIALRRRVHDAAQQAITDQPVTRR